MTTLLIRLDAVTKSFLTFSKTPFDELKGVLSEVVSNLEYEDIDESVSFRYATLFLSTSQDVAIICVPSAGKCPRWSKKQLRSFENRRSRLFKKCKRSVIVVYVLTINVLKQCGSLIPSIGLPTLIITKYEPLINCRA